MICNECKSEIGISEEVVKEYQVPFKCNTCGNIKFPYKALNGIVFLWPKPIEEKTKGGLHIPEIYKENFKSFYAVVLSVGKGCKNKKTNQFVEAEIQSGDIVIYDKSIPWTSEVEDSEGKKHKVSMANILDINAKVSAN